MNMFITNNCKYNGNLDDENMKKFIERSKKDTKKYKKKLKNIKIDSFIKIRKRKDNEK